MRTYTYNAVVRFGNSLMVARIRNYKTLEANMDKVRDEIRRSCTAAGLKNIKSVAVSRSLLGGWR